MNEEKKVLDLLETIAGGVNRLENEMKEVRQDISNMDNRLTRVEERLETYLEKTAEQEEQINTINGKFNKLKDVC
jgi:chromosome segregation ATPase